jgi:5-methylcytosine-specific restriction protein A
MTTSIPMPCLSPGCRALRQPPARYCAIHNKEVNAEQKSSKLFYHSAVWRKVSRAFKSCHPICAVCGREPTQEIDHIVRLKDGGLPYDWSNLQGLCSSCHAVKRSAESRIAR